MWRLLDKKQCEACGSAFSPKYKVSKKYWAGRKFCSYVCRGVFMKGKMPKNLIVLQARSVSDETRLRMSLAQRGENNHSWNPNREEVVKTADGRNDTEYRIWRKRVWLRDGFKCVIANQDCAGRIEAHHILGWSSHPELRYEINNGITLCRAHHPIVRAEEKRLAPFFMELVSVSKQNISAATKNLPQ